ncbi:MAG: HNH endonuclease [Sedimentisphaerales bacterium]|nr:HNH endonuclease [Sedimentisphaerales bacterium]
MSERTCHDCVYSNWNPVACLRGLETGRLACLTCVNHVEAPGRIRDVCSGRPCRNFRGRRRPPVRIEPPRPPSDDVRYIALTRGKFAIVDAADYERLSRYRWYASRSAGKTYARRNTRLGTILMHREIVHAPKGLIVDHFDGNGLNNRRSNLRICTPWQNVHNSGPHGRGSKFKGVYPSGDKWYAVIKHKGRTHYLGTFADEVEAAKARDRAARALQGKFAYLNFPEEIYNYDKEE